jgi:beta-glucosidase
MKLIENSARIAAIEASADGINWTFSPVVYICRDARWGRIAEGNGEDPYLASQIATAMVKDYQGNDLKENNTIMSCVKHYALYGAAEAGRDYNTVDMSRQTMYNVYFPPFKAAVDAGVSSFMASFNKIEGVPATANKWLLTNVLLKQWSFKGFVVTDYTGNNEMIDHGIGDLQTVTYRALNAGIDMDMVGEGFLTTLKKSLAESKTTLAQIDAACRRILEAKYRLGLFDDPYKYCNENRAKAEVFTPAHRKTAREAAAQSFVLLKNQGNILPLKKSGTIALVGPLADNRENMPGTWAVAARFSEAVSVSQGLKETVGDKVKILHARGSNLDADSLFEERAGMFGKSLRRDNCPAEVMIKEAVDISSQSDVVVVAAGESAEMTGASSSRSNYLDVSNDPVYPFGYGLSYTGFSYSDIKLSSVSLKGNQTLTASVAVTNSGKYDGKEVVQLYVRDVAGSVTRPVKELKGFQKIDLKAGETKTVTFSISPEDLKFYNYDLKYKWEPGEFEIMIGANSADVKKGRVNWIK